MRQEGTEVRERSNKRRKEVDKGGNKTKEER